MRGTRTTSGKPLPRKQRVLNRGYLYTRKDEKVKNPEVTLMDMDSAIISYFDEVIQPSVDDNGENTKVPIMYASPERWKAIKRDGFMRDKKRQIITPVIAYRRTSIEKDQSIPQDKLDANNPNLFYTFEKKFSQENRYDNFSKSFYDKAQKSFIKIAKNKKNYFILDSSENNSHLEKKIFDITSRYLKIK